VAFANNPISGAIILAAMFVGNPTVAWACLLAGVVGVVFSKILKQPEALISDGVVVFNGILVGCISVAVFPSLTGHDIDAKFWGILTLFLVISCYVDTGLNAIMSPCRVPALSVPFNITAALMLLSLRGGVGLTGTDLPPQSQHHPVNLTTDTNTTETMQQQVQEVEVQWLKVMEGTLLAAGQVYGVGTIDSSILVYLAFLLYSPLLTIFFYMGSVIGTIAGVFLSEAPYTAVYQGLWGYNSLLTSGSMVFFLVPTPSALLAAVVGSVLAVVVQAASSHVFAAMTVPVLSYPFNVATLLLLAISISNTSNENPAPLLWIHNKSFPEKHLFNHIINRPQQQEYINNDPQMMKADYIEILVKISLALESVEKCNYVHNCICMDNFCISDLSSDVKVTLVSFGRSCPAQSFNTSRSNKHCTPFPSPELSQGEKCLTPASDVYSLARVLATTFRGHRIEKAREEEEKREGQEEEEKKREGQEEEEKREGQEEEEEEEKRETASEEKLQEQQKQKKEKEEKSSSQETKVQDVERVDHLDVEKDKEEGECERKNDDNIVEQKKYEDVKVTLVSFGRSCPAQSFNASHSNKHCTPFPSPELSQGEKCLTPASDVYSLARVLTTTFRGHRIGDITRDWADRVLRSRSPQERPKLEELIVVLNQSKQLQLQNTNDLMGSGSLTTTVGIGDEKERAVQKKERKRKKATMDEAHKQSKKKKEEEKDFNETIIERDQWKKQECEESLESYILTLKNNNVTVLKPQQLCSLLETIDSKSNPVKHYAPFPSPELSQGEKCLTPASDVYSLARVLATTFRGHRIEKAREEEEKREGQEEEEKREGQEEEEKREGQEEEEKREGQEEEEEEEKRETASEEKLQEQQKQKKEKEERSGSQETKVQDVEKKKEEGKCESDNLELEKWKRDFKMSLSEESGEEEKPLQLIDKRRSKRVSEDELLSPPKKTRVKEGDDNNNQETGSKSDE
ncbi:hypothetical protein Pmani_035977, partial [Petrolisthes manimaculis]